MEIKTPQEQVKEWFFKSLRDEGNWSEYESNQMGIIRGEGSGYYTFSEEKAEEFFSEVVEAIKKNF